MQIICIQRCFVKPKSGQCGMTGALLDGTLPDTMSLNMCQCARLPSPAQFAKISSQIQSMSTVPIKTHLL